MIPEHIDIAGLSSLLGDATVVIDDTFPLDDTVDPATLESEVANAAAAEPAMGTVKMALVPGEGISSADLRDVAQGIKDSTGATTVIVHSPDNTAVVAENFSRFAIETHTSALANPANAESAADVATSTAHFAELVAADQPPTLTITGLVLAGTITCIATGAFATKLITKVTRT